MKINIKRLLACPISLFLVSCFLFVDNTSFAAPLECPTLPVFDQETQCLKAGFFERDGPEHIREINEKFDTQLEEIFRDNIANPTYSVKMITQDLRTYDTCFTDLCLKIEEDCSSGSYNNIVPTQSKWCNDRHNEFLALQKVKTEYFLSQNISRKYRSLYEEKMARIGYRFYKYIHKTSMQRTIESLQFAKIMIQWLIKYPVMYEQI